MKYAYKMLLTAAGSLISASTSWADTLPTHRIPAAVAVEAASFPWKQPSHLLRLGWMFKPSAARYCRGFSELTGRHCAWPRVKARQQHG